MLSMCYLKLYQLTPYQCPLPGLSFFSRRQSLCPYSLLPRIPGRCIFSFHLKSAPCPKGNKKKSHDRRLVALATHHVFKLFYLKYDLFNFHYGYQQSLMYMLYQKLIVVSTYL